MAPSEQFSQLSQQATARFEAAVEEVRQEILARLRAGLQATEEAVTAIAPLPPMDLLPPEIEAGLAAPPAAPAGPAALLEGLRALDAAPSQSELLAALVSGALSFAARSALFLTAAQGARGWVAGGFTGDLLAIDDLAIASGPGTPLGRLAAAPGVMALTAAECASLVGELGAEPAEEGFLVPLVLRDRLAAALYLDRREDDPPVEVTAAQVLVFCAGQGLELQAGRERAATPTLYLAAAAPVAVPLWDEAEPPAPIEATEAAEAAEAAEETAEEPVAAEAAAPAAIEEADEAPAVLAEAEPAWELAEEAPAALEPEPAFELPAEPEPFAGVVAAPSWETEEDDTAVSAAPLLPAEPAAEPVGGEPWAGPAPTWEEPAAELPAEAVSAPETEVEPFAPAPAGELPVEEPRSGPEAGPAEPPAVEPEPEAEARLGAETQRIPVYAPPPPAIDTTDDETVLIPRPGPFPAPAAAEPAPPAPVWAPAPRPVPPKGGEVAPPPDLDGPGWAFTASRQSAASGDQALHEEARRLARLLIDEIKLYNEEQVEAGRRHRDIYSRLREDIERARQTYEGRAHERVRATADYFRQELVRILAGGDPGALGE